MGKIAVLQNGVKALVSATLALLLLQNVATAAPDDGSTLPFPPTPSASVAKPRLQDSTHHRRVEKEHFPKDAPNIVIILLDDVGFGLPDTYGGPIHTPALSRIANEGISYNAFHTTSICSPTRAALLTGRNHQRVGSGTIAERAVDWDGYTGVIPRTSATLAKVLGEYGYKTAAFAKWHNTPATETTAMGPFTRWPTGEGVGFDYFYGFLAGETSQWEPRLVENLNVIEPPHDPKYHLSEDLADRAVTWMKRHRAFSPDKPFFMYWAPGASHGPHHIFKDWADKYKGRFDDGWDALREATYKRQKELGWIPADAKLTPRADNMAGWDSIPAAERPFQLRLVEVFAGFTEHVDAQVGKLIDGLDETPSHKHTQYFDNNGSRGIYHDGWFAGTFGPLVPWDTAGSAARLKDWDSAKDVWELYDLSKDYSQADNLADKEPKHLAAMKQLFLKEAEKNKAYPIGAGIWLRIHPEDRIKTPYTNWRFDQTTTRMPEFAAPDLGRESNHVVIVAELGAKASGVLYALGGASGGLTVYLDDGRLAYEYNMMIIERYTTRSKDRLSAGKHRIEVDTTITKPGAPAAVILTVDGAEVAQLDVKRTVPAAFTASETLDVGVDLGSPVSLDYFDRRPFAFNGRINSVNVDLK
jgi:arylsulfatase A-like enzyme